MTTPSQETLLPCPICFKADYLNIKDRSGYYNIGGPFHYKWIVSCDFCCLDLTAPTKQEAIQRWNTRTTPPTDLTQKGGDVQMEDFKQYKKNLTSPEPPSELSRGEFNHPATLCCNKNYPLTIPYPVYWNEFNKVVQCHSCGQVYEPKPKEKDLTQKGEGE